MKDKFYNMFRDVGIVLCVVGQFEYYYLENIFDGICISLIGMLLILSPFVNEIKKECDNNEHRKKENSN